MTTETAETQAPQRNTIVVSDTMQMVLDAKRVIEGIAKNRSQSDELRRYARGCLGPINALVAQALAELS